MCLLSDQKDFGIPHHIREKRCGTLLKWTRGHTVLGWSLWLAFHHTLIVSNGKLPTWLTDSAWYDWLTDWPVGLCEEGAVDDGEAGSDGELLQRADGVRRPHNQQERHQVAWQGPCKSWRNEGMSGIKDEWYLYRVTRTVAEQSLLTAILKLSFSTTGPVKMVR